MHFRIQFVQSVRTVAVLGAALAAALPARGAGVAAMGDSLGDEYAFPINFPQGGNRQAGGALNYVTLLSSLRPASFDFGPYSTASRGTPRNEGFEFNFARDGSTSGDLIAEGQHTGAATLVAAGRVDLVLLEIGGNDFRGVFLPGADPLRIVSEGLTNTLTAAGTVLAADPRARVAVANVPDITRLPEARFAAMQDPTLVPVLAQVSGLIEQYNGAMAAQLGAMPGSERVVLVDLNTIFDGLIDDPNLLLNGRPVDTLVPGDGPGHLFVDVLHPGTVGSGYLANGFIDALNTKFDLGVPRLSDLEIYTAAQTPEPGAFSAVVVPAVLLLRCRRRD
jgi:lysophospholipase L1-like esterase